ncbi:unnamed protein product [Lactuca saligna]|uniref:NAC domain-containing protein n=1 Tax=Lactuca saligna TaxID=75948 RepID=A0AA36A4K0_LACSI|nr:unnamed protein product [Lactuca saligna]
MESTDSSTSSQQPHLPPGFRFHPTDEELVVHYLKKKAASAPLPVAIIAEVDLYKFDPWELPAKAAFGEQEWYFFSPRDRKYPNGARPNRAATSGYWKATGTDKPVLTAGGTQKVGVKKALVFYGGKPPKGVKTNWIMHEYRLTDGKSICKPPGCDPVKNKGSLRLDDWVLCRIYKKSNMQRPVDSDGGGGGSDLTMNGMMVSPPASRSFNHQGIMKPTGGYTGYNTMMENHEHTNVLYENVMLSTNSDADDNNHHHHNMTTSNLLQTRRLTLPGLFWNEEGNTGNSSSSTAYTKMFLTSENNQDGSPMAAQPTGTTEENNGSMGSLLSQIPQTVSVAQMHQQTMLVAPGESIFRQQFQLPDMNNWYS